MHVESIISAHYYDVGVAFDIELCLILTKKYAIIIVTNLHETISLYNKKIIVTQYNQHSQCSRVQPQDSTQCR